MTRVPYPVVFALALLVQPPGARAQSEAAAPELPHLEARHTEVSAAIEAGEAPRGELERLERVLSRLIGEARRGEELAAATGGDPVELPPPPYTLADYDAALLAVEEAESLLAGAEDAATQASAALAAGREGFDREPAAAREGESESAAALRLEAARAELDLLRAQLDNARRTVVFGEHQLAERRERLARIASAVEPTPAERESALAAIARESAALSRRRERNGQQQASARERIAALERRVAGGAGEAVGLELEARRSDLASLEAASALLAERIDRAERARELSERRFALFSSPAPDRATLRAWREQSAASHASLLREIRLGRAELEAAELEAARLADAPASTATRVRLAALERTESALGEHLESLTRAAGREERLQRGLDQRIGTPGLAERWEELRTTLASLWSFEITQSEDRPVTLGKVVLALLTFAIGVLVAGWVTHWLGSRVLRRVGVDEGASHAYQSLAYYALLAVAFLLALRAVSIPLTAFAVVGGALAIGVGFGSQNVVNNFISGVILLAERPIKKGDLVEVEQTYGNVERIGLRSTRVRTGENIHVIVPNAAFLEHNVINWTHNGPQVRLKISVGVIYGSDTREAERLILLALQEHERVLDTPAPIVLFTEFGDNSLDFQALFWVRVRNMMDRLKVESDLRFRIDDLYREAGLVIAFPQRDVHLDAADPIPVQLVEARKPPRKRT